MTKQNFVSSFNFPLAKYNDNKVVEPILSIAKFYFEVSCFGEYNTVLM